MILDMHGRVLLDGTTEEQIRAMSSPVQCRCGSVYDLGTVTVTARYADCSMWKAPCCGHVADDRSPGWGGLHHYEEIVMR